VSGGDHLRRIVDPDRARSAPGDFLRQRAFAAADVEDVLARFRIEQVERGEPEIGDERSDLRIVRRVPAARRGG